MIFGVHACSKSIKVTNITRGLGISVSVLITEGEVERRKWTQIFNASNLESIDLPLYTALELGNKVEIIHLVGERCELQAQLIH